MNFNFRLNSFEDRISLNINENDKWSELANSKDYLNTIFSKVDNGNDTVETKEINLLQRLYNIMINVINFGVDNYIDCDHLSEKIENGSINLEQIKENLEAEEKNDYKTTEKTVLMGNYNVKVITTNKVVEKAHYHDEANNSPVVNAYTGSLDITNSKTGKTYTINLTWDTTLPDDAIEKLLNALQETIKIVPESVAEDIFMENKELYIFDGEGYANFNAYVKPDKITLVYKNIQGESALRPRVLIHETGHNVNFTKDNTVVFNFFSKKQQTPEEVSKVVIDYPDSNDDINTLSDDIGQLGYTNHLEFISDFVLYKRGEKPLNENFVDFISKYDLSKEWPDNNSIEIALYNLNRVIDSVQKHPEANRGWAFLDKMLRLYQNNQFPKIYALASPMEFFAEYYTYKAVGDRKDLINDRGAAYLFDSMKASGDPEQVAILEYLDNMIEEIHNKSIDVRVGYDINVE